MISYVALYNKNAAFYRKCPMAKLALRLINAALTLGFILAYGLLLWHGLQNGFTPQKLTGLLCVPCTCLFLVSVLRICFPRPRPYAQNGAGIQPLLPKKKTEETSFPSRHLACASVIATVFLPYFTGVAVGLYCAALLLGYVRFSAGVHYPSDLLAGFLFGGGIGALIFLF